MVIVLQKFLLLYFFVSAIFFFCLSLISDFKFHSNLLRDITAIPGLTLGAPAVYYFLDGSIIGTALLLWLLNTLFFISSAFYVHMKMFQHHQDDNSSKKIVYNNLRKLNLAYQLFLLTAIPVFIIQRQLNFSIFLAFLPMMIHCTIGSFTKTEKVNFKKIGFTFVGYALIFGLLSHITNI